MRPLVMRIRLTGVTFMPGYPESLYRILEPAAEAHAAGEPMAAVLIRRPENAVDQAAIAVDVPALGGQVGWIPNPINLGLARSLDRGERWAAAVIGVAIDPGHPERPGLEIEVRPVDPREEQAA